MYSCIFHSGDYDGICSAAVVYMKYPDVSLIPMNRGMELDISQLAGKTVYIVDYSFSRSEMVKLMAVCEKVIWIDHHISAQEDLKDLVLAGKRSTHQPSACQLTWEYLFPEHEMPMVVNYCSLYDTWTHDRLPWEDITALQNSLDMLAPEARKPDSGVWGRLLSDNAYTIELIQQGRLLNKYRTVANKKLMTLSFEAKLYAGNEEYDAICINAPQLNSDAFASVWDPTRHSLMLSFHLNKYGYKYTIYTSRNDIDCAKIAKSFGGGGHNKAAGWQLPKELELPFRIKEKNDDS